MTQDQSNGYCDTWEFLDRRLEEWRAVGSLSANVTSYLGFTTRAAFNVMRSKKILFY